MAHRSKRSDLDDYDCNSMEIVKRAELNNDFDVLFKPYDSVSQSFTFGKEA